MMARDPLTQALDLQERLQTWLEVTLPPKTDGLVIVEALTYQIAWIIAVNSLQQSQADLARDYDHIDTNLRAYVQIIRRQLIQ
jgi:hypothetical protein